MGPLLGALVRELAVNMVAYAIAALLLAIALGFLVAALYLGLAGVVEPVLAALFTALVLVALAALVLLAVRRRRPRRPPAAAIGVEALLLSMREQVQRDPWSTLVAAAVLGALTEFSHGSSRPPPS